MSDVHDGTLVADSPAAGPVIMGKGSDDKYHPVSVDSSGNLALSAGTGASSLGKAEDAAHTSGDVGVMMLGVRNDNAASALSGTNGDYTPIATTSAGRVWMVGVSNEDDPSASTQQGMAPLGVRNDTDATQTSASGDYGFVILDSAGRQKVVSPLTTGTSSFPAAGSKASASIGSASGLRHVCSSLSFGLHTVAAPTATTLNVALRDGATGAGTILRQWGVRVPAAADSNVIEVDLSGLSLAGTTATAMTLEFSAALASTVQWCNLETYTVV